MQDKDVKPTELSLEEMLADPIVWLIMKSDQVEEQQLRSLLKRVAQTLIEGDAQASPTEAAIARHYRRGVGIMLLNEGNCVLVGRRIGTINAWQMPQGGLGEGEDPEEGAFRELREEIGTDKAVIIAECKGWLRYDLPQEYRKRWRGHWRGQQQKWFIMRFQGEDTDIDVATAQPEFSAWKWVPIERLPELVVSFKRQLYVDLLQQFADVMPANNAE
jgi:putative (di)nucleoside polyphosphate hydrolase